MRDFNEVSRLVCASLESDRHVTTEAAAIDSAFPGPFDARAMVVLSARFGNVADAVWLEGSDLKEALSQLIGCAKAWYDQIAWEESR